MSKLVKFQVSNWKIRHDKRYHNIKIYFVSRSGINIYNRLLLQLAESNKLYTKLHHYMYGIIMAQKKRVTLLGVAVLVKL